MLSFYGTEEHLDTNMDNASIWVATAEEQEFFLKNVLRQTLLGSTLIPVTSKPNVQRSVNSTEDIKTKTKVSRKYLGSCSEPAPKLDRR